MQTVELRVIFNSYFLFSLNPSAGPVDCISKILEYFKRSWENNFWVWYQKTPNMWEKCIIGKKKNPMCGFEKYFCTKNKVIVLIQFSTYFWSAIRSAHLLLSLALTPPGIFQLVYLSQLCCSATCCEHDSQNHLYEMQAGHLPSPSFCASRCSTVAILPWNSPSRTAGQVLEPLCSTSYHTPCIFSASATFFFQEQNCPRISALAVSSVAMSFFWVSWLPLQNIALTLFS